MILCTGAHQIENPGADSILSTQTQASVVQDGGIFQGANHRANRQKIYDFCIQNMSDKQRIQTLSKLKNEVLEAPQRNSGLSTAIPAVSEIMRDTIRHDFHIYTYSSRSMYFSYLNTILKSLKSYPRSSDFTVSVVKRT